MAGLEQWNWGTRLERFDDARDWLAGDGLEESLGERGDG
jgi:hypothetical protein